MADLNLEAQHDNVEQNFTSLGIVAVVQLAQDVLDRPTFDEASLENLRALQDDVKKCMALHYAVYAAVDPTA